MATLVLRLAAPLQSWGSNSKFNIRTTEREPTKSGVIGMIAAAMGIQRNQNTDMLSALSELSFGIGVKKEGKLIKDFHMVREMKNGKVENSHLTERYYLSDAVFIAGLESDDKELLIKISNAINNPVFPMYLGRRSCPVTLPVNLGIRDECILDVLKSETENSGRIIYDDSNEGILIQDVPVSFSQLHRKHGYRMKKEEYTGNNYEHDPMSEL